MALPTLPQQYVDSTYLPPSGGTLWTLHQGGALQATLNAAALGDIIQLDAGATWTGTFTLPNKTTGSGWLYIVSSALNALPPAGSRIDPSYASSMPKIYGPASALAIATVANAHHVRFVGVEFAPAAGVTQHTLVQIGNNETSTATLPDHIIFDRCYAHGDPSVGGTLWGLRLDGAFIAVVDSYLANFRDTVNDATAIQVINGSGPYKIANNFIEASGESVMFGGQDPSITNLVPGDIEVRGNYMTKRLSWRAGDPAYAGSQVIVKNVFELKNAQNVLVDSNIFENNWKQADQDGFAIVFTPRNQGNTASWSDVRDVTFAHNTVRHSTAGMHMLGYDNIHTSQQLQRVLVRDNLFYDIGAFAVNGGSVGTVVQMKDGVADATIDHNTMFGSGDSLHAQVNTGTANTGLVYTNNVTFSDVTSDAVGPTNVGTSALNASWPSAVFTANVMIGRTAAAYPAGNFFPSANTPVVNAYYGGTDYRLVPKSPYAGAGTDSKDLGADFATQTATTLDTAFGAPTTGIMHLETIAAIAASATSLAATFTQAFQSGDFVVVASRADSAGPVTVSDNLNGAYATAWGPVGHNWQHYKANCRAAGANGMGVTVADATPGFLRLIASHFQGVARSQPLVATSTNTVATSTAWTAGTITSVAPGQLAYVSWGIDPGVTAQFSVGQIANQYGWTVLQLPQPASGTNGLSGMQFTPRTVAGPQNSTAAASTASTWNGGQSVFMGGGSAMPITVVQPYTSIQDLSTPYSAINIRYARLTGDAAYPQTGYPVTPGTFGFSNAIIAVHPVNAAGSQYYTWYDLSNKSIHFIIPGNSTLSEVATGTSLSAVSLDVAVLGY